MPTDHWTLVSFLDYFDGRISLPETFFFDRVLDPVCFLLAINP